MHEVAESSACALSHLVLAATGFAEIGDGRQLAINGQSVVPAVVQIRHCLGSVLFLSELHVHIADQMIAQVIADVHLLHFSVFVLHFEEDVFEKVIVVLLLFHVRHGRCGLSRRRRVLQVPITVLEDDGLGESGFVVEAGASRAVATSADFDVEGTIHFVLFRTENRGQVFSHVCFCIFTSLVLLFFLLIKQIKEF